MDKLKHINLELETQDKSGECHRTKPKPTPSKEYLHSLLEYNAETGELFWKKRVGGKGIESWNAVYAGTVAFTNSKNRYCCGSIDKSTYKAHRIIWKMVYGTEPEFIDHINGDTRDNRLANLRSASCREQSRNMPIFKNNSSGYVGVHWCKTRGAWRASICRKNLGEFPTKELAIEARKRAEEEWGFHSNHGRKNDVSYEHIIKGLVEALKYYQELDDRLKNFTNGFADKPSIDKSSVAREALQNLPEDLRK